MGGINISRRMVWMYSALVTCALLVAFFYLFPALPRHMPAPRPRPMLVKLVSTSQADEAGETELVGDYGLWSPALISLPLMVMRRRQARGGPHEEAWLPISPREQHAMFLARPFDKSADGFVLPEPPVTLRHGPAQNFSIWHPKEPVVFPVLQPCPDLAVEVNAGLRAADLDLSPLLAEPWPAGDQPISAAAWVEFGPDGSVRHALLESSSGNQPIDFMLISALRECYAWRAPCEGRVRIVVPAKPQTPSQTTNRRNSVSG